MYLSAAVSQTLLESHLPVVTEYELFLLAARLIQTGTYRGNAITRLPIEWDYRRARRLARRLHFAGTLVPDPDFSGVWRIVNAESPGTTEEACCLVDPFCYVSHFTAMQRYGFTDRSPLYVQLTRPSRPLWNRLASEKAANDFSELTLELGDDLPRLIQVGLIHQVRRRSVHIFESSHPAVPRKIRGEHARISSIGRTFRDMLDESSLCGGMDHVLEVWEKFARTHFDEIVHEIDIHPKKLTKVRAGYLLEELIGIQDSRVQAWRQFAQRGGSQKLDPEKPYSSTFSEAWMLSLNV